MGLRDVIWWCQWCGADLPDRQSGGYSKTCSPQCSREHERDYNRRYREAIKRRRAERHEQVRAAQ